MLLEPKREGRGDRPSARVKRGSPARATGSAGSRGSAVERCLVCSVVRSADGSRLADRQCWGPCDGRAEARTGRAWVTLLDREIVDSVSIAAATAAILVAGRREERSSVVRGHGGGGSRFVTASALGVVVLLAAVGVVAVFGPPRARGTKAAAAPPPVAVRVNGRADIPRRGGRSAEAHLSRRLLRAAPTTFACTSGAGSSRATGASSTLRGARRCRLDAAAAAPAASVALRVRARSRG